MQACRHATRMYATMVQVWEGQGGAGPTCAVQSQEQVRQVVRAARFVKPRHLRNQARRQDHACRATSGARHDGGSVRSVGGGEGGARRRRRGGGQPQRSRWSRRFWVESMLAPPMAPITLFAVVEGAILLAAAPKECLTQHSLAQVSGT